MILLCRKRSSVCLWRHHARKAKTLRRLWQVVFLGMRIKWIHIGMLPPASNIHLQNYIYNLYEHVKQMIPIKTFIWYCYWQGFFSIPKRLIRIFMLFRCPRVEDIFDGRFYSCFNVPPLQPKRIVPFRAKCSCVWRGCIWIARTWPTGYWATMNMCVFESLKEPCPHFITTIYTCIAYEDYTDELKSK